MIIKEKTLLANVVRLCSSSVWVAKMINYMHTAVLVLHLPLLCISLLLYPPPSQSQFGHRHLVTRICGDTVLHSCIPYWVVVLIVLSRFADARLSE